MKKRIGQHNESLSEPFFLYRDVVLAIPFREKAGVDNVQYITTTTFVNTPIMSHFPDTPFCDTALAVLGRKKQLHCHGF